MMSCSKACACRSLVPFSRTLWLPDVEAMLQSWITHGHVGHIHSCRGPAAEWASSGLAPCAAEKAQAELSVDCCKRHSISSAEWIWIWVLSLKARSYPPHTDTNIPHTPGSS